MDTIVSYNLNGWKPVTNLSYLDKIRTVGKYILGTYKESLPEVIGLQEMIGGADAKYLSDLNEALDENYNILTPPNFDHLTHHRSIMNVTLVRKDLIITEVRPIGSILPNRIFDVIILIDGRPVHVINYYAVQIQNFRGKADWYILDRTVKHEELWRALLLAAETVKDDFVILLGDLQENSKNGNNILKLSKMGYCEKIAGFPTVCNDFFSEQSIDHILYSRRAFELFKPSSFALDGNLLGEVSDHSMLVAISA